MKIALTVSLGYDGLSNISYWHILCNATGAPADAPHMEATLNMLWERLCADKKSFARLPPYTREDAEFDDDSLKLFGGFRLTTSAEPGELIKPLPQPTRYL